MRKILFAAILAWGAVGCAEATFKLTVLDKVVEVTKDDVPVDYGTKDAKFDLRVAAYDEVGKLPIGQADLKLKEAGDKESQTLSVAVKETGDATVGSLRQLNTALRNLHFEQLERNRTLVALVISAHKMQYEAYLSEERASRDKKGAEYEKLYAKQTKGEAVGASGGALAGAAIGSVVPVVGTVIGGVVGLFAGLFGGHVATAAPPPPAPPNDNELIKIAGNKAGLGDDPEKTLKDMTVTLAAQLIKAEVATLETMNASNAIILRRAMFNAEDGLVLAEVASSTYKEVEDLYKTASDLWGKNQEEWKNAAALHERAQVAWKAARNQIIVTVVVSAAMETFTKATAETTAEYRDRLETKGMKLRGDQDVDHIIPKAKGGVDHPWNYQAVSSSLNRAWQDGHLFEKCVGNPIGFAKALAVNYPGLVGAGAGGLAFWTTVRSGGADSI